MKLSELTAESILSEDFETSQFGIGDQRVVIEILRSKMYSNPPRTIVQELLSNARDANREAHRPNTPILVHLPTPIDCNFRVIDYGPGITPDRMENIFVKYGNSTKRRSNYQTGGFGLGAKSPFSYTDTFNIVTVSKDELGKKKKRSYVAYIDKTKMGALSLVDTEDVSDDTMTGTMITVPVLKEDRQKFISNYVVVTEFWQVRPRLVDLDSNEPTGFVDSSILESKTENPTYPTRKWLVEDSEGRWKVIEESRAYQRDREHVLIIDGIPYKLDVTAAFDDKADKDRASKFGQPIYMFFKTGEVAVTANREGIDYNNEDSVSNIRSCILALYSSIKLYIQDAAEKSSPFPITQLYNLKSLSKKILGDAHALEYWKGIPIHSISVLSSHSYMGNAGYRIYTKRSYSYRSSQGSKIGIDNIAYPFRVLDREPTDRSGEAIGCFFLLRSDAQFASIRKPKRLERLIELSREYTKKIGEVIDSEDFSVYLMLVPVPNSKDSDREQEIKLRLTKLLSLMEIPYLDAAIDLTSLDPPRIKATRTKRDYVSLYNFPFRPNGRSERSREDFNPDSPRKDIALFVTTDSGIKLGLSQENGTVGSGRYSETSNVATVVQDFGYKTYAADTKTCERLARKGWKFAEDVLGDYFEEFSKLQDSLLLYLAQEFYNKFGSISSKSGSDNYSRRRRSRRLGPFSVLMKRRKDIDPDAGFNDIFDLLEKVASCEDLIEIYDNYISYTRYARALGRTGLNIFRSEAANIPQSVVSEILERFEEKVTDLRITYPLMNVLDEDIYQEVLRESSYTDYEDEEYSKSRRERMMEGIEGVIVYINSVCRDNKSAERAKRDNSNRQEYQDVDL